MTSAEILEQFGLTAGRLPIEIPNAGRDDLARWLGEWHLDHGVEIGTSVGEYALTLLGANPRLNLWCVDPYETYEGYGDNDAFRVRGLPIAIPETYDIAVRTLAPHYGRVTLVRKFSVEAAKDVPDRSLDFVYVDANHDYAHVYEDIAVWSPKVRSGGILAGHDFRKKVGRHDWGVVEAVTDYARDHAIDPWFVIGAKAMTPGTVRDIYRSWMWVNP